MSATTMKRGRRIKARDACVLNLSADGINIRAEFRMKDANLLIRMFTTQAMRNKAACKAFEK